MTALWRELATRSAWLTTGSVLGRLAPYAALIALGRRLDPGSFATLSLAFAWGGVAASLVTAALGAVTTQRLAADPGPARRALATRAIGQGFAGSGLLAAAVLALGPTAASLAFNEHVRPVAVWPAALHGLAWSMVLLIANLLNGLHAPRRAALLLGVGGMAQSCGIALGLLADGDLAVSLWGLAGGSALSLAIAGALLRGALPARRAQARPPLHAPGMDVFWTTIATASVTPVSFAAAALITHGGAPVDELAQYQALEQIHQLLLYAPGLLGQALLPILASHDRSQQAWQLLRPWVWRTALAGLAAAALIGWQAQWLLQALGNPAVTDPWATRWMLCNASLAWSLSLLHNDLMARRLYAPAALLSVLWAAVFLSLGGALGGAAGMQAGRLFASLLLLATVFALTRRPPRHP